MLHLLYITLSKYQMKTFAVLFFTLITWLSSNSQITVKEGFKSKNIYREFEKYKVIDKYYRSDSTYLQFTFKDQSQYGQKLITLKFKDTVEIISFFNILKSCIDEDKNLELEFNNKKIFLDKNKNPSVTVSLDGGYITLKKEELLLIIESIKNNY